MAIQKLYRVVVRQRVNWLPGVDGTVPEDAKPLETEGSSIVRDITAFVSNYKISTSRQSIANDTTIDIINPLGQLTPTNPNSPFNRTTLAGIDTYTPLLVEGNEIQIYRIPQGQDPTNQANWIPRFRGVIHRIDPSTSQGQDTLQIAASSVLSILLKRSFTGTFSPIMRTTSLIPANSFFTLPTLVSAVAMFRNVYLPTQMPMQYTVTASLFGDPSVTDPQEMPAEQLSKMLWWDRNDVFYSDAAVPTYLAPPYFIGGAMNVTDDGGDTTTIDDSETPFQDERAETAHTAIPVNANTATAIWNLNGQAWFLEAGIITKDNTEILNDQLGSLKCSNSTFSFELTAFPCNVPSRLTFGYKITDNSTINIQILLRTYNRETQTYQTSVGTSVNTTVTGPTPFDVSSLGGMLLNTPVGTGFQWQIGEVDIPAFDSGLFSADSNTVITLATVIFTVVGDAWIDQPSWEFLSVGMNADGTSCNVDANVLALPRYERWTTTDGITYSSPYPSHMVFSKKNNRIVARNFGVPYAAGTLKGFGPNNMRNRCLPEDGMYERDLRENTDYVTLYDKGAIQLTNTLKCSDIYVSGTYFDINSSAHMEAATALTKLMVEGVIPATKINLETTGVVLSAISLGVNTSTSLLKAVKDILDQLPQNYHLFEDGDGNVIGRFIQQAGSPRLFNPVIQTPLPQVQTGVLVPGAEYWYGVTALMPDGKETLVSNLMSTVAYSDYYDFMHASIVTPGSIPSLQIKPVPNMVGLVIRRAKAFQTAMDVVTPPNPVPCFSLALSGSLTPPTPIATVTVTTGGSGYTQGDTVLAVGGIGIGFMGYAVVGNATVNGKTVTGVVQSVVIENPGSYSAAPTGFSCADSGSGTGFTATCTMAPPTTPSLVDLRDGFTSCPVVLLTKNQTTANQNGK